MRNFVIYLCIILRYYSDRIFALSYKLEKSNKSEMEKFLEKQAVTANKIKNSYTNLMAKGREKITAGATKIMMKAVESYWQKFQETHDEFINTGDADAKNDYFKTTYIDTVESSFLDVMGQLQDVLDSFNPVAVPTQEALSNNNVATEQQNYEMHSGTVSSFFLGRNRRLIVF